MSDLLTRDQLMAELQISDRTLRKWQADGKIPVAIQIGRVSRYSLAAVRASLEKATKRANRALDLRPAKD